MDAFETIRIIAARLHRQLVEGGANALAPHSLIDAAVKHFDLELTYLEPGNTALKGARAVFDGQSGTICCENTGSDVDRALLVAHEIGHSVVHAKSSCCNADDIDPSRSMETVPVGLQKIEDYGARERRELEANVFAREFLFPRDLARHLHVDELKTAAGISESTGLPVPLVRQQILDALLLPEIVPEAPKAPMLFDEDQPQEAAAVHRSTPYQLLAGPGTGKTRTLVRRVQSLLDQGAHAPSLLVLTFSNRTAGELTERLTRAIGENAAAMWVGTFHGFGLDIVRRFHDRLGLPAAPTLFDRSDAIAILEEILPTLPLVHYRNLWDPVIVLREILQAISRAKDELKTTQEYRALAQAMKDKAGDDPDAVEAADKCLEIAAIYEFYENAKTKHGAVDFGDLIMLPARLIGDDEAVRAAVQLRHQHVLVDEAQDVNRASVLLVRALAGDGRNLWVVGDARQSIYRFRGASSANMAAFADDFPSAQSGQLEISYRSTQKVIDTFGDFARDMPMPPAMARLDLRAARGSGDFLPEIRTFVTPADEAAGIAASVRELEHAGVALRDQAVLCRTNRRLNEMARELEDRGIPVLHLGSLFERDEIRDLLCILTLAADRFGSGLVRIATMPRYAMPAQDVKRLLDHLENGDKPTIARLGELATVPELSVGAVAAVSRLAEDLRGIKASSSPCDVLTSYLLDRTDGARAMAAGTDIGARMRAIAVWQFLNFLRDQSPVSTGSPIQTLLDRVRNLVLLAEERDLRHVPDAALQMNAVRLMTAHAAKGLEFEAVHIPGLTVESMPGKYSGTRCPPPAGLIAGATGTVAEAARASHDQEEECLFFVAMSRARTHLRIYRAEKQANGGNRTASPYLARIAGRARTVPSPAMLPLPEDARPQEMIKVSIPDGWERTHSRIALYEKCPRRFFYTHIFGLGTARRATPFSRTHDCIYEVIEWLASERPTRPPTLEEARAKLDSIWPLRGPPADHAFAADYRALAERLVAVLVQSGAGRLFREANPLAIDYRNGTVIVKPDEISERDGVIVVRRIRTGQRSEKEFDGLEYALFQRAAARHFGSSALVEALHLTDSDSMDVPALTARKEKTREESGENILEGIAAGRFPIKWSAFSCPRCPHFFICAAAPEGDLTVT